MSSGLTNFGALLKRYRMAAGLTQEALAERARLSARTIADLERGINRVPRHDTLQMLIEALNVTEPQRTLLLSSARPAMAVPAAQTGSESPPPLPPTALVGREREMARALTFLDRDCVRLLTLTGPGGVGKTRLGIELAHELGGRFEDGVVFVALAPLRDSSLLPTLLAQALGLRETLPGSVVEQIREHLQEKHLLLVLDNFEHVNGAAPVIADLLASCVHLQFLITSRAPLRVRGEQEFAIAPLTSDAAVTLFRARAQSVQPGRTDDWSVVAAICERVDRLPLAIELAARRVKVLALPLLLERLTTRLPLLRDGARDLPERQQTMESAIAWSYELLTASQQRCFRALAVFAGGWTLPGAETVCEREGLLARDGVLEALAALVEHSLVCVESSGAGTSRFSLLETLREYALDRLREAGEEEWTRRQHAYYYAEWVEAAVFSTPGQDRRQVELVPEFPNARVALGWAIQQREMVLGLNLATHFGRLWFVHGQILEGRAWLEQMLALDASAGEQAAPLSFRIAALSAAGRLAMSQGHEAQATALAQESLQLAERTGDRVGLSRALATLGSLAQARGDLEQAARYFSASYCEATQAGNTHALDMALLNLAELARLQGALARARALLEESLSNSRKTGTVWGTANTLTLLGHLAREQQDYPLARVRYRESLCLYRTLRNLTYTAWCLEGMAALDCTEQYYVRAVQLCAAAETLRGQEQTPRPRVEQEAFDVTVMAVRAALDDATFGDAWTAGLALTQEEAITFALSGACMTEKPRLGP